MPDEAPHGYPARKGTVTAVMTAHRQQPPPKGWPVNSPVRYEGHQNGGLLAIRPAHPCLDAARSGAELTPSAVPSFSRERGSLPPQLDIEIVNGGDATIFVNAVRLTITRSTPLVERVPVAMAARVEWGDRNRVTGPVSFLPPADRTGGAVDAALRFRLEHPADGHPLTSEHSWPGYTFRSSPGTEAEFRRHPLLLALAEAGAFPVPRPAEADWQPAYMSGSWHTDPTVAWDFGLLPDGRAVLAGEVTYAQDAHDGTRLTGERRFRVPLLLSVPAPGPSPSAARGPALAASVTREPEPPGPPCDLGPLEVPVSNVLMAGDADRLLLSIPAGSPGTHEFRVSIVLESGTVNCGAVLLETYALEPAEIPEITARWAQQP